jgi:ribonuclease-3
MHPLLLFKNQKLLIQALTHRSYVNEHPETEDNERLEFLGDAVLNFLSGEYLYKRYPTMGEGDLTIRRSRLVEEKQLAKFALEVGLADEMLLGKGAILDRGRQNPNLLSSTFEAVVGAYYLDNNSDFTSVHQIITPLFASVPEQLILDLQNSQERSIKDSKSRLQEWVAKRKSIIKYDTKHIGGPPNNPLFLARVLIDEAEWGKGNGCSKQDAEKMAAENALSKVAEHEVVH